MTGLSWVAGVRGVTGGKTFHGVSAASGEAMEPAFHSASVDELDAAVTGALEAFQSDALGSAERRGGLLRAIAQGLEEAAGALVARAMLETGLPEARLTGEVGRTSNQLRLFASVIEEGSWVDARLDSALPDRKPLPRPDLRSMLCPTGPVAVFGASNFPLAFSVAGGDTASALAAGNPVIVKAHAAHPGTSELTANIIAAAVADAGLPPGTFSMLFDAGYELGAALVTHPGVEAVAFTGSRRGGRALMDLAAGRERPIPCFTEMSSVNPVFVLAGALTDPGTRAKGLHTSFTLGAGQFCTKPGVVFLPGGAGAAEFTAELRTLTAGCGGFTMLTPGIAAAYTRGLAERRRLGVEHTASGEGGAVLWETDVETYSTQQTLQEELFGPSTVLVRYERKEEMLRAADELEGHLTATILGTEEDLSDNRELVAIMERKVGRLLFNGFPTGVEVSHAMVHGGPYPATSDGRSTSVGSAAMLRFVRPRCYQSFPQAALPVELRDENAMGIWRMVDGTFCPPAKR